MFESGRLLTTFLQNQNMGPPLHCLNFCQISNFLSGVSCSVSKWPEKNCIWYANFYLASESSTPNQIGWGISVKRFISENDFDHSQAKESSMNRFLTISGHLDTRPPTPVKNFEIWLHLRRVGGGPLRRNQPIHTPDF